MTSEQASECIHVVTSGNANYVPHAAAMLHSLLSSNPASQFNVFFLHNEQLEPEHLRRLDQLLSSRGHRFSGVAVKNGLFDHMPTTNNYPEEAWYRLKLPQLLPKLSKVLWLDADTIIQQPITELWNTDLKDKKIAAVANPLGGAAKNLATNLGLPADALYFNSGIMLIDMARLTSALTDQAVADYLDKHAQYVRYADQDVLNGLFYNDWVRLHPRWNLITSALHAFQRHNQVHGKQTATEARNNPAIIHFTTAGAKPWLHQCSHPWRKLYLRHRKLAGWGKPDYSDRTLKSITLKPIPFGPRFLLSSLVRRNWYLIDQFLRPNAKAKH